ncbi:MAG: chloride channel protein [Bradymonadaceae bacterium]
MELDDVREKLEDAIGGRFPLQSESLAKLHFPGWHTSRTTRLVALSVALGFVGGLAGWGFLALIRLSEQFLLHGIAGYAPPGLASDAPGPIPDVSTRMWLIPVVTTIGGLVSGGLVYWLAPSAEKSGMDSVIHSFHQQGGSMSVQVPFVKAIASAVTIGSGGSVGREGPMAQIGAALGNLLAKPLGLEVPDRRILVLAGVAAGISVMFKSPLGAALVAVEVLYSRVDFEVDALMYTIIAASVAYATGGLFGSWEPLFAIPPGLRLGGPVELIWYALLGLVAGGVGLVLPHAVYSIESWCETLPIPRTLRPAFGGLAVGLLALVVPHVLAGGYGWIERALQAELSIGLLVVLVLAKILATSLTIGSGGSGGVFAPALYVGCMLGTGLAATLHWVAPTLTADIHVAAMGVVGMAAIFSGVARAPVSTLVMAAEMTGGYGLLVPTMIATVTAYLICQSVDSRLHPPHPKLYRSQTPSRLHSPTHQSEYIQNVLQVMDDAEIDLAHDRVSWRELELHLRQGDPVPMGPEGEYLYSAHVDASSDFAGKRIRELPLVSNEVLIASIMRDGHHLTPRGDTELEPGDLLLVIAEEDQVPALSEHVDVIRHDGSEDRADEG